MLHNRAVAGRGAVGGGGTRFSLNGLRVYGLRLEFYHLGWTRTKKKTVNRYFK